jgi:hypothetical protein
VINYSIFDEEYIFENWEKFNPEYEIINYKPGIKLKIERINQNQAKIEQVICSDPKKYLEQKFIPGNIIEFTLDF